MTRTKQARNKKTTKAGRHEDRTSLGGITSCLGVSVVNFPETLSILIHSQDPKMTGTAGSRQIILGSIFL